jgi:polysaccharide biosynthesis protein PslG
MQRAAAVLLLACWLAPLRSQVAEPGPVQRKPVSFAILEDYDKGDDLDAIAADFALAAELELSTWRGSIGWDDYEPDRGEYDFEWLHDFVRLADRHHIRLRPYIAYTPEWAAGAYEGEAWNRPPARLQDWERFAAALGRALGAHRNVESYEIYNEQNVAQWWDGPAEVYAEVLRAGSRALRAAHPGAAVLFGGLVFPDADWVEAVCGVAGAGAAFDILPFHAYPETWTPPGVTVENYLDGLNGFVAAADRACGRKPLWINEAGYATTDGRSERDHANWWVRAVATFLAAPRVEHIGIYEVRDLPPDRPAIGDTPNYHLGLVRSDRTRKLAFHTVDLLTDLFDVRTLAVETARLDVAVLQGEAGDLHYHLFGRPDGDRVLVAWDRLASPTLRLEVDLPISSVEFDLDGRPLHWDPEASVLSRLTFTRGVPRIFRLSPRL